MQKIIWPNDLEIADSNVALLKEKFKIDVNDGPPGKILNHLNRLPDLLKNSLASAIQENPERCKRGLILIRQEALHWYLLDYIEDVSCNMLLHKLKNELKWYIDETERVYNSLSSSTKAQTDKSEHITETKANPKKFKDVFANEGWEKYIVALQNTSPPLLNESWEFIGNAKKHKGVICAWIKGLQYKGIVKQTVSRMQLVFVLNSELKNFNLGKDGKTLDNISKVYDNDFKKQLETITK